MDLLTNDDIKLAEHAEVIRALGKRVVGDIMEIGRRLIDAKKRCGHGNWLPWIEAEFGWTEMTALNFMRVAEHPKSKNFLDLHVPVSGLYLLARPDTPEEVIEAVAERSAEGERLSLDEVKEMIAEASDKAAKAERGEAEERIAKLTAEYDGQVAELREAAEKAEPGLSGQEIEALIDKAVEPLKKKIEDYKKRLSKKPVKRIPDPHGLVAMQLRMGLEGLVEVMKNITPNQKIESQQITTEVTGKPLLDGLADDVKNSKLILEWLRQFLDEVKRLK